MSNPVTLPLPLNEIDMREEIELTTYHLSAFLRSHLKLAKPGTPAAAVSAAMLKHLKGLKPSDLGLPDVWPMQAEKYAPGGYVGEMAEKNFARVAQVSPELSTGANLVAAAG